MNDLVRRDTFSGSILITRDGKVLVRKSFGSANIELGAPNTPETKFRIGSLSKAFTAMAVMILQDRGQLAIEDGVCKYVPDCPVAWSNVIVHHL